MTLLDDRPTTTGFAAALVRALRGPRALAELVALSSNVIRHVRTEEGSKLFDQPIGAIITLDMLHPLVKDLKMLNEFPVGTQIVHAKGKGKEVIYTKKAGGYWESSATKKYGVSGALGPLVVTDQLRVRHLPGEDDLNAAHAEHPNVPAAPEGKPAAGAAKTPAKAPSTPPTAPTPAPQAPTKAPNAAATPGAPQGPTSNIGGGGPAGVPDTGPAKVAGPSAPTGEKVSDLAGLHALDTGAQIKYTTTSGDVRTYTKESDGRWSGPSGYHDATDFSQGAKEGRVIKIAPAAPDTSKAPDTQGAPSAAPDAPSAPDTSAAPEASKTPFESDTLHKPEALTGKVDTVADLKAAPLGSVMYHTSIDGKVHKTTKTDQGNWKAENGTLAYESSLFKAEVEKGRLSWDKPGEPTTPAPELKAQAKEEDVKSLKDITDKAQANTAANVGNFESNKQKLNGYPVGTKIKIGEATYEKKEITSKKTGETSPYWGNANGAYGAYAAGTLATSPHEVISDTPDKANEPDPESYFAAAPEAAATPAAESTPEPVNLEDGRWQIGPLTMAGTTGKGKKALADALQAASTKVGDKNDAAALATAVGVLTSANWATYGGPEKHGAQLATVRDNPSMLTTAGLSKADVDARVKSLGELAKYLDKTSGTYGMPYGQIEVATVTGKTSPSIGDYLKRFSNGYNDKKTTLRSDHKDKIAADKAKAEADAHAASEKGKADAAKAKADADKAKADEQAAADKAKAEEDAVIQKLADAQAKEAEIKALNSQAPEDKAFIDKPGNVPYTNAEITNAPIGSKVVVKDKYTNKLATYTKTTASSYWKWDEGYANVHMPSEAEAGTVFNVDQSKAAGADGMVGFEPSSHAELDSAPAGTVVKPKLGSTKFEKQANGKWKSQSSTGEYFSEDMKLDNLTYEKMGDGTSSSPNWEDSLIDTPPVAAPGLKPPDAPGALKMVQFNVAGTPFTTPPGTKLYANATGDSPDIIAVHPDGEMYLHGSVNGHVVAHKQDETTVPILQSLMDKGHWVDKTGDLSGATKLHPSGLKPGKYSKGPNAKVYMIVNADGTAMYVDKAGNAKVLGTKGVLGNHASGMQYHSEFTGTLPIPGTGAVSSDMTFKADGNQDEFTVPAGSKVYHVGSKTPETALTKYVQYPDGTWGKVNSQTNGKVEPVPLDLVPDLASSTNETGLVEDTSGVKAKAVKGVKATKATGPDLTTVDEHGFVPNPFSAPPSFSYKTSELSAEIGRLVEESGFKGVGGLNRGSMTKSQKQEWLKAWYVGDFETAYNIELSATVGKDENTKVKDMQELIDAPVGTKIVSIEYKDSYSWVKNEDGNWLRTDDSYGQIRTNDQFYYKIVGYNSSVHFLSKAVHTKAAKHPGSPDNPANAGGVKKVQFGSPVAGELPAGVKPTGGEGTGLTADLSEFSNDNAATWTTEQIDAYMLAAGMVNSQGLKSHEKANWVAYHYRGNKPGTDAMSVKAKNNTDKGVYYSEELTPPSDVIPAGTSIPDFIPEKAFTIEASHANNLSEAEVRAYLAPLFTKKAGAAIKAQPVDVMRAIVQLHWLSTQPPTKGAHKSPTAAAFEFSDLAKSVEEQMAPKVANYNGVLDYSIALPEFEAKQIWKKAPQEEQPNYKGAFEKYDIKDDSGNILFFKPGKSDWRLDVADSANKMGTLFGFKTPASQIIEVDGVNGQAQKKVPNSGSTKGMRPEDLTEKQLMDLFREHLLDWTIDQDDAHDDQFLMTPDGGLVGIDKDRAFASQTTGHKGNLLERGALSTNPSVYEKSYYEDLYSSAAMGKISPEILQKAYKQVMSRANTMQNVSDDKYRALLENAWKNNPKMSNAQREEHIQTALVRKNSLVADFDKFWTDVLGEAGVDKPDPSKVSDAPGLHAGITPEMIADVKKARNWGHAAFFDSQDLEDGHLLLWEEKSVGGGAENLNGQGLLLKAGDDKMAEWIKEHYTGPNSISPPVDVSKSLPGLNEHSDSIKAGVITIAKHLGDGEYNQSSIDNMLKTKATLEKSLASGQPPPGYQFMTDEPKKQATFNEMAAQYIKTIDDVLAAKESGVKPAQFTPYNYVWQPEDGDPGGVAAQIELAPQFKVTKRSAKMRVAKLDDHTGILTDAGHEDSSGQDGQEYVIDFPDGSQITWRGWSSGTSISQKGRLNFHVPLYGDNHAQGEKIMNFLRDEVGIEAGDATDESLELQYWRTYYGTMSQRSDFSSGKSGKVEQAVSESDPRKLSDPAAELDRWRAVMAEMTNPDQVAKFVEEKKFLPQFAKTTLQDKDGVHGRPYWDRFDVDLDKMRLNDEFLARSVHGLSGGNYPQADDKILANILRGGVAPNEERMHTSGFFKNGVSGDSDSAVGAGSFTMIRQNIESSDYHIYFDPAAMARVSSYAYSSDNFGNASYKGSAGHWSMSQQTKHSNHSNEGVIKGGLSILSDGLLAVFSSSVKRQQAIDMYRGKGIEEINGTPLEEFFVLRSDRTKALANAHARLKARVLDTGYDSSLGSFAGKAPVVHKLTPEGGWATIDDVKNAPVGSKFTNNSETTFWTKKGLTGWEKSDNFSSNTSFVSSADVEHMSSYGDSVKVMTYGDTPKTQTSPTPTEIGKQITHDSFKSAPVGATFSYDNDYGETKNWIKYAVGNGEFGWEPTDDPSNSAVESDALSIAEKNYAIWTAWPMSAPAAQHPNIGQTPTSDTITNAPIGAKMVGTLDPGVAYTKIGADQWEAQSTGKIGNQDKLTGQEEKFYQFEWSEWPTSTSGDSMVGTQITTAGVGDPVHSFAEANAQPTYTEISVSTSYEEHTIYKSQDGEWYHNDDENHTPLDSADWQHMLASTDMEYTEVPAGTTQQSEPDTQSSGEPNAVLDKKYNTNNGYVPESAVVSVADALAAGSKMTFRSPAPVHNPFNVSDEVIEYEKLDDGKWKVISSTNPDTFNESFTFDSSGFMTAETLKVTYDSRAPFLDLLHTDPHAMDNADAGKDNTGKTMLHSHAELNDLPVGAKIHSSNKAQFTKQPDDSWKDETGWGYKASDFSLAISDGGYWKLPEAEWDAPPPAEPLTIKSTYGLAELPEGAKVMVTYSGEKVTYTKMPNGNWFGTGTGLTGIPNNDVLFKDAFWFGGSVVTVPTGEPPKSELHQTGPVSHLSDLEGAPVGTRIKRTYSSGLVRSFIKTGLGTWKKDNDGVIFTGDVVGPLHQLEWTTEAIGVDDALGAGFTNADYDFVKIMAGV